MANDTVNEALDERLQLQKTADKIMGLPYAERWRGIKKLLFKIHPDFVQPDRLHCEAVAELRNFGQANEFGSNTDGAAQKSAKMRHLFKIPTYVWHALKADRDFDRLQNSNNEDDIKTLHKALWDAFPEYRAARRY